MDEAPRDSASANEDSSTSQNAHNCCQIGAQDLLAIPGLSEQLYATLAVSLAAFSAGIVQGWGGPAMEILMTSQSPIGSTMEKSQTSLIVVAMLVSAMCNMMTCGVFMDRFGRRAGCWYLNFFAPVGWSFLINAANLREIYFGAVLIGSVIVSGRVVGVVFLSEVTNDRIRGPSIALLMLFYSSGMLSSHLLAEFFSFQTLNIVGLIVSLTFPFAFWRMPESPQFLLLKNRFREAKISLACYHGLGVVDEEMQKLENRRQSCIAALKQVLGQNVARREVAIVIFLHVLSELMGTTVMELYTGVIVKENDNRWETSSRASALIAFFRFLAGLTSVYFVEKFGRKMSLTASIAVMGLALSALSGLRAFTSYEDGKTQFWGPFACLMWYTVANQIFLASVEVICSEILSPNFKGLAMATGGTLKSITIIITLLTYSGLETVASYGYFVFEASFCFLGLIIAVLVVPETRGKTLKEVQSSFGG